LPEVGGGHGRRSPGSEVLGGEVVASHGSDVFVYLVGSDRCNCIVRGLREQMLA
jgi:hypothetical protein